MAVAYYIVPYATRAPDAPRERYCAINDFTADLAAVGGAWGEIEILGDRAIVKVRAPAAALTQLEAVYYRFPPLDLDDLLGSLSQADRDALWAQAAAAGYTQQEITDRFPNLGQVSFRKALNFLRSRRFAPRWDGAAIVLDGPMRECQALQALDVI